MANGVYQGADTMKATRAQSLWDVLQGQKRHTKKQDTPRGYKAIASTFGDILKKAVPGYGHVADVGIDMLSKKYLPMPEYKEEDGSFWGSRQISEYGEQADLISKGADPSFLESIIGNIGDYVGVGTDKEFDWASMFGGGDEEWSPMNYAGDFSPELLSQFAPNRVSEEFRMAQGGRVPKYYGGGSVSGGSPTIAGYFSQQGKTLGGSNTQSLAKKLGRI